jgi:hypothetical protein
MKHFPIADLARTNHVFLGRLLQAAGPFPWKVLAGRGILRNYGRNNNSPETRAGIVAANKMSNFLSLVTRGLLHFAGMKFR